MNQKELRRLSRSDLLEMMLSLSKENELLRKDLYQARQQLEDRRLTVESSGSLAEAVLKLNGVMQAAQEACDQYTLNIRAQADELLDQAREKLAAAEGRSGEIIAQAREQARKILAEAERNRARQEEKYSWITELMENSEEA